MSVHPKRILADDVAAAPPPAPAARRERELFRSADLLVRAVTRPGDRLCYVTFDSYTDAPVLDRVGFGEDHFRARDVSAIHVISRDNQWYQYEELPQALAAVAAAARDHELVIAYGSSMGGFAALHYGADCGADVAIAISPQYSIDPDIAPFERRWLIEAQQTRFRKDVTRPVPVQYVAYDPHDILDRQHFELFAERSPTIGIRAPYGGHPVGGFLNEAGLLSKLIRAIEERTLDATAFERAVRAGRRRSGQYLFTLSRRVPLHRIRQKVALARMAVDAVADEPHYISNLAMQLDKAGEHAEAYALHQEALERSGGGLHQRFSLMLHYEHIGDLDSASRLLDDLLAEFPERRVLQASRIRQRRLRRHRSWWGRMLARPWFDTKLDFLAELMRGGAVGPHLFARPASLRERLGAIALNVGVSRAVIP